MSERQQIWDEQRWDDPTWVAALRAAIEAELRAKHGEDWYQQQQATADENWNVALFQLGELPDEPNAPQ